MIALDQSWSWNSPSAVRRASEFLMSAEGPAILPDEQPMITKSIKNTHVFTTQVLGLT